MKTKLSILVVVLPVLAVSTIVWANDLEKVLKALADQGPGHYQEPPRYANGTGYYPYTPPPPQVDPTIRNQHAYDVGYRVGQDDFHAHFAMHFVRHPDLYDDGTKDAFAHGYTNGYSIAREAAASRDRAYAKPVANSQHVKSEHYASGYSPYAPPPKDAKPSDRKQHAFEVGFRAGQDDYHKKLDKHFTRHQALYDQETHESFSNGYDRGYDASRSHKK